MSFGKGEFLSVEKVHKIKIAVAVGRPFGASVDCSVRETLFLRCLRYIPEVEAYRVDVGYCNVISDQFRYHFMQAIVNRNRNRVQNFEAEKAVTLLSVFSGYRPPI